MSLDVNISQLRTQASNYSREIFLARWTRQQARHLVSNVGNALEEFGTELTRSKTDLNILLTQATMAVTRAEEHLAQMTLQSEQAARNRDAAQASVRSTERSLENLRSRLRNSPPDTQTSLQMSDLQRALNASQSRLASSRSSLQRSQDRVQDARSDLNDLRDIVTQIREEISENDRLSIVLLNAAIKADEFNGTEAGFDATITRANTLVENIREFATNLENADQSGALLYELDFLSKIKGQPSYESLIIFNAQSQVGTHETSENFVAGKPYAQASMAWCADFVRWVLQDSGIDIDASGRDALSTDYPVARAWAYYGAAGGGYGRWGSAADAQPGDLLIDRYNGTPTTGGHISIVVEVNVNGNPLLVRTIGGNEDNPNGGSDGVISQIKDLSTDGRYLVTLAELNNN